MSWPGATIVVAGMEWQDSVFPFERLRVRP
jgi:hypothetical protein